MDVQSGVEFYYNHTPGAARVQYEIQCDPDDGPFEIEVVDENGNPAGVFSVSRGKTEDHFFEVPVGGRMRCTAGNGRCVWKGGSIRALLAQRLRTFGARTVSLGRGCSQLVPRELRPKPLFAIYLVLVVWVNLYICRQAFLIEYTGRMNSIQGFWIAIARLGGPRWYKPSWWPYSYNGMPFEYTYAPLVPGLSAAIGRLFHLSAARGLQAVLGLTYCLGPLGFFLMARQLTRRTGWSFVAAMVYSLSAPTELVLPDTQLSFLHVRDARRLYLSAVWDELPHQLALALTCLAVCLIASALEDRKFRTFAWAGVFVSLSMLASAFGATELLLIVGCLIATHDTANWNRNFRAVALLGIAGYLAMCPFLPPSLLLTIRTNTKVYQNLQWTASSTWTCVAVLLGGVLLWFLSRKWRPWYLRFFFLITYLMFIIPAVYEKFGLHFILEPDRYKVELEMVLPLLLVFGIALAVDRFPKFVRVALGIGLLWCAYRQVITHRRYSKDTIQAVDMSKTIEYQVARWVEPNLPGWRLMAMGSFWSWMDAFTRVPQFTGGSYPTVPNMVQLRAESDLPGSVKETALPSLWYRAYGVDAVVVPGRDSPEFWGPHLRGHQFDPVFSVVWEARDTGIYAVPRPVRSLAHVIPKGSVVSLVPAGTGETKLVKIYVAALEKDAANPATFDWIDDNHARIQATVGADDALSVQVTYHPGWKAQSGGVTLPVSKDGIGQIVLSPAHAGQYDIALVYDGGWENKICRAISPLTILTAMVFYFRRRPVVPANVNGVESATSKRA